MNTISKNPTMKKLTSGLILSTLALAGLAATGCDERSAEQAAALTSGKPLDAGSPATGPVKGVERSRLIIQHNETFLVA